jgi:uncharacterized protein YegJ (DUF2314 family)
MSEPVFTFDDSDAAMQSAYDAARRNFKYFWRELSWERRRIVPGLDMAMVKLPFTDGPRTDGNPAYEQMWIGDVNFDGETLSGALLNSPNRLTSVKEGDAVQAPFSELRDWLMTADGKAYGAFSVNQIRAAMSSKERKEHDQAWGFDFGDPATTRVEILRQGNSKGGLLSGLFGGRSGKSNPLEGFQDHPMCVNMLEKYGAQLRDDASIARDVLDDETGFTLLHSEALAGNLGMVKLLVACGAEVRKKTKSGRTASELARGIGWPEIADYLDEQTKAS